MDYEPFLGVSMRLSRHNWTLLRKRKMRTRRNLMYFMLLLEVRGKKLQFASIVLIKGTSLTILVPKTYFLYGWSSERGSRQDSSMQSWALVLESLSTNSRVSQRYLSRSFKSMPKRSRGELLRLKSKRSGKAQRNLTTSENTRQRSLIWD